MGAVARLRPAAERTVSPTWEAWGRGDRQGDHRGCGLVTEAAALVRSDGPPAAGYAGKVSCCGEPMVEIRPRERGEVHVPRFTGLFTDAHGQQWSMLACATCGSTRMVASAVVDPRPRVTT